MGEVGEVGSAAGGRPTRQRRGARLSQWALHLRADGEEAVLYLLRLVEHEK